MSGKGRGHLTPEQVRARMNVGNPASAQHTPLAPGENANESVMELTLDLIKVWENNPRTKVNPNYNEIKASIKARRALQNKLRVTKRPGESIYTLSDGGKTRLQILWELYEETGDPVFYRQQVIYTAYQSELDLLVRHLMENGARGDVLFWDQARATMEAATLIQEELSGGDGKPVKQLSLRDLEEELRQRGVTNAGRSVLQDYRFATQRLAGLGDFRILLTRNQVRDIISPAWAKLRRLAEKFDISETDFETLTNEASETFSVLLIDKADGIDSAQLISAWKDQLAIAIGHPVANINQMLDLLDVQPEASRDELLAPDTASTASQTPTTSAANEGDSTNPQSPDANTSPAEKTSEPGDSNGNAKRQPPATTAGASTKKVSPKFTQSPGESNAATASQLQQDLDLGDVDSVWAGSIALPENAEHQLRLLRAVVRFAQECQIADCLRFSNAMPLLFWIEIPDDESGISMDLLAGEENSPYPYRYQAWWLLANLSMSLQQAYQTHIPSSRLSSAMASEEGWTDAVNRVLGEPIYPDLMGFALGWICNPTHRIGHHLLELMSAIRATRNNTENQPESL